MFVSFLIGYMVGGFLVGVVLGILGAYIVYWRSDLNEGFWDIYKKNPLIGAGISAILVTLVFRSTANVWTIVVPITTAGFLTYNEIRKEEYEL